MTIYQVLILAIVEGVTEFLPISSTGHLVLVSSILGVEQTKFVKSFEIAIQLGAILAVVAMYARKLLIDRRLLKLVAISFLPSAVLGLAFYKFIKEFLIGNTVVTLWALFIGGIILILWERKYDKVQPLRMQRLDLSIAGAFKIGLFQTLSMTPGVSRAGATIIGAMAVGLSRRAAVEYSFLLAIPTMAAATGLDLIKTGWRFNNNEFGLIGIGFFGSFLVAAITVKWLTSFVKSRTLAIFGWYRILLAVLWWLA